MSRIRRIFWLIIPAAVIIVFLILYFGIGEGNDEGDDNGDQERIDAAVTEMMARMSLEEKVGQVIIAYFNGPEFTPELAEEFRELHLGGVILYGVTGNIESLEQVAGLTAQIQQSAVDAGGVPLFITIDQEGGNVVRLTEGVTVFPGNMALGATGSEELAGLSAAVTANELRILGINFNFAPVVDVNNNPDNPVIGVRSFGSDPAEVARLGVAMVGPYRRAGVLATAKHYPGHGDTDVDSHFGLPLIPHDLPRLAEIELLPFREMVAAGIPAVMTAHILVPGLTGGDGLPATLSPRAISYLREEIGFEGLIVSDAMSMAAITEHWELGEASVMAFGAGVDLVLFGPWIGFEEGDRRRVFTALKEAVEDGTISVERLDESVKRILTYKKKYGLVDDPWPRPDSLHELVSPENLDVARNIARESVTLVRDRASVIPLSPDEAVPLLWPAEREDALAPLLEVSPYLQPHLAPLRPSPRKTEELLQSLGDFPLVLAATYNLRDNPAWADLVNALAGETEVAVLAIASPYDLTVVPAAGAYLCTYSDTAVSMQALGEVLNGALVPRGRLPVELPGIGE